MIRARVKSNSRLPSLCCLLYFHRYYLLLVPPVPVPQHECTRKGKNKPKHSKTKNQSRKTPKPKIAHCYATLCHAMPVLSIPARSR